MSRIRKIKSNSEPSLRDKLTTAFVTALEADWQQHGTEIIQTLREKDPRAYAEIVAKLTTPVEPPPAPGEFSASQSSAEIARKMLVDIGTPDESITPSMIEAATRAQLIFVAELERIAARSAGREPH